MAANEEEAILGATEELLREVMQRNSLGSGGHGLLPVHRHAGPRRAVPRRGRPRPRPERGVPLMCAREIDVPGALPRVIRADAALQPQPAEPKRSRSTSTCARPEKLRAASHTPSQPSWASSSSAASRAFRSTPQARTYEFGGTLVKLASNETPLRPPAPGCDLGGIERAAGDTQPLPGPGQLRAARRVGAPPRPWRRGVAVGNGSCDILLAAGEALLEPGAELVYAWPSFSMYPNLAAAT